MKGQPDLSLVRDELSGRYVRWQSLEIHVNKVYTGFTPVHCFCIFVPFPYQEKRPEFENNRRGRNGGTNTAIPHMIAPEYRNIAPKFSQIPKPQLQMGKR